MYLIAGATGNVGGELVRALTGAGEPVRALIRSDADKAKLPEGAEGFVGDLNDPKPLSPALAGVRGAGEPRSFEEWTVEHADPFRQI